MKHYHNLGKNASKIYLCVFSAKTQKSTLKDQSRLSYLISFLSKKIQRKSVSSPEEMRPLSFPKKWVDLFLRGKFPDGFTERTPSKDLRIYSILEATETFCFEHSDFFLRIFLVHNKSDEGYSLLLPEYFQEPGEVIAFAGEFIDPKDYALMFCLKPKSSSSS